MKKVSCPTCRRSTDPQVMPLGRNEVFECSHVDCPHRRPGASLLGPTPLRGPTGAEVERAKRAADKRGEL